ncbi:RNA polymerase sigma factor [Chitinophaga arvensicola]|uniref:RNA polymerase sigma-70 factor, ECF subfamily n=1 Tax=Chitinophaga arvensicola TaxID=29529 RepID=A0A1I0SAB8_9BACT|nr:sigma-70 family RNA polymerase sigma factor [Chitinophaga arvensicola]SEW53336.1 RNA polymerase sigma-70 factor, ECF subfamily [Chitinophaga arvensicola]
MEWETLSEKTLIKLLKKQNILAFNELYYRYCSELYATAYKRLRSKDMVQDIIQEIFISLWNNAENFDEELPLRPYLFKSLKYKIIDAIYKDKSNSHVSLTDLGGIELTIEAWPNDPLMVKELETFLNNEIDNLPLKMKEVFLMSRKQYLPNEKIAELLSISSQTVKNQISLALKRLKQSLDNYNAY